MRSTKELIRAMKKQLGGEARDAFDCFCRAKYLPLVAYAETFIGSFWAEDIVQDALFEIWKRRKNLDEEKNIDGYLLRSVFNACIDVISRKRRFTLWDEDAVEDILKAAADLNPDNNPILSAIFDYERSLILIEAINDLPDKCKEVFCLSFHNGLTNQEISEKLGISLKTVKNHKYLALKKLKTICAKQQL